MNCKFSFLVESILLLFFLNFKSTAQYENVWAFGAFAGIDFNNGTPRAIKTNINTNEGCASICDSTGALLFYTDGTDIWDTDHNLMPNGKNLIGATKNVTESTEQGVLIVPMPGNSEKYYIFSLGCQEADINYAGNLYYSIVDMNLNNGRGDVVAGNKGILLDSNLLEFMRSVSGNNCNVWLLVGSDSHPLKAYNIDYNGIDTTPIISVEVARPVNDGLGFAYIDISPDRKKIAICRNFTSTWNRDVILCNFDPNSGKASDPVSFPHFGAPHALCFSHDNSKLYISYVNLLLQFDLNLTDSLSIFNSAVAIAGNLNNREIKRAPDGKIYCASGTGNLNIINQPNLPGTACQYIANGFPLFSGTKSNNGLPNSITIVNYRVIQSSKKDTAFCVATLLLTAGDTSGVDYVWDDGSIGPARLVHKTGTYWVTYNINSQCIVDKYIDTFNVVFDFSTRNIYTTTRNSGLCKSDTIIMKASNPNGNNYTWSDESVGPQRAINQTGVYWLSYNIDSLCEKHVDSFLINYPQKEYKVSFIVDTIVCQKTIVRFQNASDSHYNDFKWSFGDQNFSLLEDPEHSYVKSGDYIVTLSGTINGICADTVYQTIIVDSQISSSFDISPGSICAGESISFSHQMNNPSIIELNWSFGDGSFTSINDNQFQHSYEKPGLMSVSLKAQFRSCPESSFIDTTYVFDLPNVNLGASYATTCINDGTPVILNNLAENVSGKYHYLWNTGDTTIFLNVVDAGIYSLRLSAEPLGCSTIESIEVKKNCHIDIPNVFTPNSDGVNDYFFPRQLLSQEVTAFHMQIFNRWGQLLFETHNSSGRGWDGKYNGKEQPPGVYVYHIKTTLNYQYTETYQSNITLIR